MEDPLCQDAPAVTCRPVLGLPNCDCALCRKLASGRWWHCVACSCVPCSVAREVERRVYATVPHGKRCEVYQRGDGSAAVVVGDLVVQVAAAEYPEPC